MQGAPKKLTGKVRQWKREIFHRKRHFGVSNGGSPLLDGLFHGKSHPKIDDRG